ncbi:MAG: 3-deoxy-D-manno-octulosonic acid transferase [Candidatus Omnitrophica bacterium]|nr:3-deoxy-D-manno-octulosonic acid transferase [Candidatus Omnitrophota bacterium]
MTRLLLGIYQAALLFAGIPLLLWRWAQGKRTPGIRQRLGLYDPKLLRALNRLQYPVWIHLVSVGEVMAAKVLIEELRRRFPEKPWVITTVTPTGYSVARELLRGGRDQLLYLPWDFGPVVRRAIEAIRPCLFLVFETELWPCLFHGLAARRVPIVLVNGRISPGAYRRYLLGRFFMRRVLAPVGLVITQSPQDARRYAALGAAKDRIAVTGNIKWDLQSPGNGSPDSPSFREVLRLPPEAVLWTAGSTHPKEEKILLAAFLRLKSAHPALRLLIAPRHPERVGQVEEEAEGLGVRTLRRSRLKEGVASEADSVILLDTLGELTEAYRASDLVFVGGSLVPHGGHNLIEPALSRRPILTGPHLHNFQTIAESLIAAGGVQIVESQQGLEAAAARLLADSRAREELGNRAHGAIQGHRGATARTVELILRKYEKAFLS